MYRYHHLKLIFIILLCSAAPHLHAQTLTRNVALYTKVWGFLKYHHPNVATGHINWDSVFIAHINQVMAARNLPQLNAEITATINAAGRVQATVQAQVPAGVFTANHDLGWLNQATELSRANRAKLKFIYAHRNQSDNRFIRYDNHSDFSGEFQYADMKWPAMPYRLLFLARFWNVINYFDPYKYVIGEDWNHVLNRFIPKFISMKDTLAYYKMLLQLSVALHDRHSNVTIAGDNRPVESLIYGSYTAPIYPEIAGNTVMVRELANDSLCRAAGIKRGDIILAINGVPVAKKISELRAYVSASNKVRQNNHISNLLFDSPLTSQHLTLKRKDQLWVTDVKNMLKADKNWQYINNYTANETGYKAIGKSIAYVYAAQIWHGNMDTIKALIRSKKAVIFDVRNYPNGDDFYNIFDMFLPKPTEINLSTKFLPDHPGYFRWEPSNKIGGVNPAIYQGKVVILVDERTQSQGEYSAMALQTIPNSVTIGSKTAGSDGTVSLIPMGGGLAVSYSGYGIYYPDKRPTQKVGVRIDIPVKKTAKSVIGNEDIILQRALQYLKAEGCD